MRDGLEAWLGSSTGGPQAELWFGAHPSAPSPLADGGGTLELSPEEAPLLVKLLAAGEPLSIQVHPRAELAAAGFAAQEADPSLGSIYADAREKTEMLVALEPFEVLAGWRPRQEAERILLALPGCQGAAETLIRAGFVAVIRELLVVGAQAAPSVPSALEGAGVGAAEVRAFRTILDHYPSDPGVVVSALLQYRRLEPGEALYVPAGVPHSYLRGLGLEVMTSSDNVLRLGLTPKPVFADAGIGALTEESSPQLVSGTGWLRASGAPFAVRILRGGDVVAARRYRLALCLEGSVSVTAGGQRADLSPGEAVAMTAGDPDAEVQARGLAAIVEAVAHEH